MLLKLPCSRSWDGTTAGNGPGPRTMFPVVKNFMLASADQVAIDAVAAKMMGFDPMALEFIRLADEAGLGIGRPAAIEVVGADIALESWGFRVGDNSASRVGDLLWFGPLRSAVADYMPAPSSSSEILGQLASYAGPTFQNLAYPYEFLHLGATGAIAIAFLVACLLGLAACTDLVRAIRSRRPVPGTFIFACLTLAA